MVRADSSPIVTALLDPEAYPYPVESVTLIQTHISYVLLTGRYAYKIKKPVNLGFLDYTTLAKRRYYCYQEVVLNSRLCPDIYLGVVGIRERAGKVALSTSGRVVEYAVKMVQLPQERMLSTLLDRGEVGVKDIDRIARKVADFHRSAASGARIGRFGEERHVLANLQENFDQTKTYIGRVIPPGQFERLQSYATQFVAEHRELFQKRVRERRIRDCHGDLRSDNICLEDGSGCPHPNPLPLRQEREQDACRRDVFIAGEAPEDTDHCLEDGVCIFDCIEFNKRFRYGDVASEVAFLAMDLEFRGHRDLARRFVEDYIGLSGDRELSLLLDFYKCYRAYVRGKVECFKLDQPELPAGGKEAAFLAAQSYFALAESYVDGEKTFAR